MKRRDLERHLRSQGCRLHHHGGRHDVWVHLATRLAAAVPRHAEVKAGTARAVCRELSVPPPAGK